MGILKDTIHIKFAEIKNAAFKVSKSKNNVTKIMQPFHTEDSSIEISIIIRQYNTLNRNSYETLIPCT
jgi:predicted RNase H-like nuclease (RuvC/YqgF family)